MTTVIVKVLTDQHQKSRYDGTLCPLQLQLTVSQNWHQ